MEPLIHTDDALTAAQEASLWYALRMRSNFERTASAHLRSRGIEEFAPTFRAERQWSDRKKQVDQYLFSGYVFCRLDSSRRVPIMTVPGAVSLVGFGHGPTPIPESEIEAIRKMVGSGLLVSPWPFLQVGQNVIVERGPLTGVEGILLEIRKTFRLVVSVNLLQRSVAAEVERAWVRPAPAKHPRPLSVTVGADPAARAS